MPKPEPLMAAVTACLDALPKVTGDLQQRPDYGASQRQAVQTLDGFKQALLTVQAASDPGTEQLAALASLASGTVLPLLGRLIADNTAISKMGQLNTNRTITPTMATAYNAALSKLQSATQELVAQLGAGGPSLSEPVDWSKADWSRFDSGEFPA
jgi:hypothetical protein